MKCKKCVKKAVFLNPDYCKNHFIEYFEKKVKHTIDRFDMLNRNDKVVVACSGGKDSISTLHLLNKLHGNVSALAIDEGISGYRPKTLMDLKLFCRENSIKLKIVSFKKEFKKTLDQMLKKQEHPCTVCGTLRRNLLNKYAKGFDKLATGHNLDDESQAILMNLLKNQTFLLNSLGLVSRKNTNFVPRVKPLYFCSEKEVATYALLKGFQISFTECPNIAVAYRAQVRDSLNDYEKNHPGTKRNIIESFLKLKPNLQQEFIPRNVEKFNEMVG